MREGRRGKFVGYFLTFLWLFSMALGGFFVPYFTDNIPFFKVKSLQIYGLETIPTNVIVDEIRNLKNNWLFINESVLMNNINKSTGNAVSKLSIKRVFSSDGVELRIRVEERKPFACVIKDQEKVYFDEDGTPFTSPYINLCDPAIFTHDIKLVKENFSNLRNFLHLMKREVREVYVTNLMVIAYTTSDTKINLPPLFMLDRSVLRQLAEINRGYNIGMEYREVEVNPEGIVILRGARQK